MPLTDRAHRGEACSALSLLDRRGRARVIAAFFHDERFNCDGSGTYYSSGAMPFGALARYLTHFDRIVVVARLDRTNRAARTVASGEGVEWACIDTAELSPARYLSVVSRRARDVLARVDCAIVRLPGVIGPIACREALRSGTPFLAEVVGDAFDAMWNHGSWTGKVGALPLALVNRHYIRRAPFATYVSRSSLQRRYPPGGTWAAVSDVIVEAPRAEVLERRIASIEERDANAPAALGLVGSYDIDYKGHETALRALALLRKSGRALTLRCIGGGDPARWRARAAALGVERWVELGGPLPQGAPVLEWMDRLDLYVIPSLQEGLPRALVEAMTRALPAVGSRRGGIPELLDAPCLHRPGDARALATVLRALLDDREAMKAQARRNWSVAMEYAPAVLQARREELVRRFKEAVLARGTGEASPC
jgi:glycosyltransferase involved in cell wall biosynthesis